MRIVKRLMLIVCIYLLQTVVHAQTEQPPLEQKDAADSRYSANAHVTSEQRISYDDVYGLELELPFTGSVEVKAATGDEIIIILEKRGRGINEDAAQTYLDAVKLEISKDDDLLRLAPQLPDTSDSNATLTRVDCFIETPPDLSLQIRTKTGNIRIHSLRGDMVLSTDTGHIYLDETMGEYQVKVGEGLIYGRILLTGDENAFEIRSGIIDLVVLDEIAAPMALTVEEGAITLRLPVAFAAEIELEVKNPDQHAITIDMPAEIETAFVGDVIHGWLNEGGPLIQLRASQRIAILASEPPPDESEGDDSDADAGDSYTEDEPSPALTVEVPKAAEPPVIDGELFETAWIKAAPLSPFYVANGVDAPSEPTQGFLLWDDRYLYIGVRAYDSQMERLRITQTKWDAAVWHDDTLEILIDPNPETPAYHHLIINPIGTVFDQIIEGGEPPNFRFADSYEQVADPTWNSRARIHTQIAPTFWTVEIALPRDAFEPASPESWRFNLHRKVQSRREYSYWSPTYDVDAPWWPHWPEQMGILSFIEPEPGVELAEQLELATIQVEGNDRIPTWEILQRLPFQPGDVISIDELSWFNRELANVSWFRDVHLETTYAITEDDEPPSIKVNLHLHVTESPTRHAKKLDLRRNKHFNSEFLRRAFDLKPERISIETLDTKSQLITNLYKHHGYELAQVHYEFFDNYLLIDIDEGHLDDVRFSGNRRIRRPELIEALSFKKGDAYNRQIGASRIERMRATLSTNNLYFKEIKNWEVKREDNRNVLAIEIQEQASVSFNPLPIIDFNRVHGLILGGRAEVSTIESASRAFGTLSNGLSSKIWNYQLGAEKTWFNRHAMSIGGSLYKLTDTSDGSRLSADEEFLSATVFGEAFLDYYQREGYQVWMKQKLTPSAHIMLEFTDEDHENLFKSTDWSLFDKDKPKRRNLRIDEGRFRTVTVGYYFDSRAYQSHKTRHFRASPSPDYRARRGWLGEISVEYTGKSLDNDFDFTLYRFQVTRYNPLSAKHYLDLRLEGGFSDTPLPRQRLLYLGGISTLRGYGLKEFFGDNMLRFNMEYRIHFGPIVPFDGSEIEMGAVTVFLDTGHTWFDDESIEFDRFNTSVGAGLSLFVTPSTALRIEIARALKKQHNFTPILRLSRMF
ncbi:MAG: BamA/TamA family outer membrane protein [Candidatus Poribacteria bacterium]|nr:BamA/TamA family outer membrane protein [Candidatus Poribacteria bacterium]